MNNPAFLVLVAILLYSAGYVSSSNIGQTDVTVTGPITVVLSVCAPAGVAEILYKLILPVEESGDE